MDHVKRTEFIDPEKCCTGMALTEDIGHAFQRASTCLRFWNECGHVADYSGRRETAINGNPGAGVNSLYILTRAPERKDGSDRQLGINLKFWNSTGFGATRTVSWRKEMGAGSAVLQGTTDIISIADTDDMPEGADLFYPVDYEPESLSTNDGIRASILTVQYCYLAHMGVVSLPLAEIDDATTYSAIPANFSTGASLRGTESGAVGTSVGALVNTQTQGDALVQGTDKVLFQTCYPSGVYCTGAAGYKAIREDSSGADMVYSISARGLKGGVSVGTQIGIVITAAANGDKIRLSSVSAGTSWVWTAGGAIATPTLLTTSDGTGTLTVRIDDTLLIEADAADLHISTVALFEDDI